MLQLLALYIIFVCKCINKFSEVEFLGHRAYKIIILINATKFSSYCLWYFALLLVILRELSSAQSCQKDELPSFGIFANWINKNCIPIVVLICISLINNEDEHLFIGLESSMYFPINCYFISFASFSVGLPY